MTTVVYHNRNKTFILKISACTNVKVETVFVNNTNCLIQKSFILIFSTSILIHKQKKVCIMGTQDSTDG